MTADLLLGLLSEEERYRRVWRAQMDRTPTSEVQQSAVARVIAEHLWETGQVDEADEALPRRLKDTVARAFSGRHLSPRTLRMFVDAFGMVPAHRTLLWDSLEQEVGTDAGRSCLPGGHRAPASAALADGTWESTTIHVLHTVSRHGVVHQRFVHVVRALEPVAAVSLPLSPTGATVVARHGATVVVPPPAPAGPASVTGSGQGVVDLRLLQPLQPGDTAVLEYDVVPDHEAVGTEARTLLHAMAPEGTVVVQIRFHARHRPRQLWWWRQDGYVPRGTYREPPTLVSLGPDHSAHRVVSGGGDGSVGFSWGW